MAKKKKGEERIRSFRISPVLDDQLKAVADVTGVTVSTLIAEAIVNFLRDYRTRIKREADTLNDERIGNLIRHSISDPLKRKRRKEGEK